MMKNVMVVIIYVVLSACQTKRVTIRDLNFSDWKNDKLGCVHYRQNTKGTLEKNKEILLSLTENEIANTFGFPEKTELIGRSEKYYFYSLSGNTKCQDSLRLLHSYLRIRFNSLGYSKEILFLQEK
ncbi:MAG: hypothetical protein NWS46_07160 [Cyclobacteriaceae bacterium]|nr:hypothetical protein [Cyclobacteriaceae bacterium]